MAQWNARAHRVYEAVEFKTYSGAVPTKAFVESALRPAAHFDPLLTYDELRAVFECVSGGHLSIADNDYFLRWLEAQFPGAKVSDLIYWPDQWLGTPGVEPALSNDQLLFALLERSGRRLPTSVR